MDPQEAYEAFCGPLNKIKISQSTSSYQFFIIKETVEIPSSMLTVYIFGCVPCHEKTDFSAFYPRLGLILSHLDYFQIMSSAKRGLHARLRMDEVVGKFQNSLFANGEQSRKPFWCKRFLAVSGTQKPSIFIFSRVGIPL